MENFLEEIILDDLYEVEEIEVGVFVCSYFNFNGVVELKMFWRLSSVFDFWENLLIEFIMCRISILSNVVFFDVDFCLVLMIFVFNNDIYYVDDRFLIDICFLLYYIWMFYIYFMIGNEFILVNILSFFRFRKVLDINENLIRGLLRLKMGDLILFLFFLG